MLNPSRTISHRHGAGALALACVMAFTGACSKHGSTVRGSDIIQPVTNEVNTAAVVVQTGVNIATLPVRAGQALTTAATAPPPPPATPQAMISRARQLALQLQSGQKRVSDLTNDERTLLIEVGKIRQQERDRQQGR